jgi:PhnB protein
MFGIYGTPFHLLDENHNHMLFAPQGGDIRSIWLNIAVPDIEETFKNAIKAGCREIAPVAKITPTIQNAVFADNFGYIWMLHQFNDK